MRSSCITLLLALSSVTVQCYLMPQNMDLVRKLFKGPQADTFFVMPYCYNTEVDEYDATVNAISNLTWPQFAKLKSEYSSLGVSHVIWYIQLSKVMEVNEKDQTVELQLRASKTWSDCRLYWNGTELPPILHLLPSYYKHLNLFEPKIALSEALTFELDSARTNVKIVPKTVIIDYDFTVMVTCDMDVTMYPFDIQFCRLTFKLIHDQTLFRFVNPFEDRNFQYVSKIMMSEYVASDVWAVVLLPGKLSNRSICENREAADEKSCKVDVLVYDLIMRRQPDYQLTNLLFPAFLILVISSCVFLVPPGSGDKMGLSVSIMLSLYMFSQLMYDKMPETGKSLPLLSRYFMVCILLLTVSCVYSAISVVVGAACPRVPSALRKLVVVVGPYLMFDLVNTRRTPPTRARPPNPNPNPNTSTNNNTNSSNDAATATAAAPDAAIGFTTESAVSSANGVSGNTKLDPEADADADDAESGSGFRLDKPETIGWVAVGALMDRCYFVLYLLTCVAVVVIYIVQGYVPWSGFSALSNIKAEDWPYICYQLWRQGAQFSDLNCPQEYLTADESDEY